MDIDLNSDAREAIRAIHDDHRMGEQVFDPDQGLILDNLIEWRLIEYRNLPEKGLYLTGRGQREHDKIMSSGDGPEELKEMFRF